jgi:hypothetical protein
MIAPGQPRHSVGCAGSDSITDFGTPSGVLEGWKSVLHRAGPLARRFS